MTAIELSAADEAKVEEFAGNLFMAALATVELANVELGTEACRRSVASNGVARVGGSGFSQNSS